MTDELEKAGYIINDKEVTDPQHYKLGDREVIDVIRDAGWMDHYLKANMLKYVLRCDKKGSTARDIRKVATCALMWLEEFGGEDAEEG